MFRVWCLMMLVCPLVQADTEWHNQQHPQWLLTNAMVVVGVGTPAEGPYDLHIKDGVIESMARSRDDGKLRALEIPRLDVEGSYVLPGFINMHAHSMYQRAGIDMAQPYQHYLWLASGITTVRDLGSDLDETLKQKKRSEQHEIIAPRMFVYPGIWGNHNEADLKKTIKQYHQRRADGIV